ncbi:hypothetical protein HUA74_43970 [Myxococcus sp. CA051A]|uniref:hypothetical protein n=1 Tax=Myxococcus sp. CA051A TaxID=2741739 RepID=UPI00157BB392|nr:hypothetical protein [Myxococcus sp. CA051A]NTX67627.1 hypothetical protein [Myxococcus sp. CA051A]
MIEMPTPSRPDQFELWADLQRSNKHLRRFLYTLLAALLVLVLALVLTTFRPLLAVRVDSLGRADLVEVLSPANAPGPEEAEHVSRLMAGYLLELTSNSVARDLGKAYGLMTTDFASAYAAKAKEDPTLTAIEKGNLRSQLVLEPQATRVRVEKDGDRPKTYFVELGGRLDVYRADVLTAPLLSTPVLIRVTLLVVPRGPRTLNGLLVAYFEREVIKQAAAPATNKGTP